MGWKNVPLASGCCTAKATCAVAKCPSGYKKKVKVDGLSCASNAASCAVGNTCCEKNTASCGGLTGVACAYGSYDVSTTWSATTKQVAKDAWNNKAATDATKNTACCTEKAQCTA